MQKTKLGISVELLGAAAIFSCFFGGYTVAVILAGYILLFEENAWLKKTAVKSVALLFGFGVLSSLIYIIPNAISLIGSFLNIFGGSFYLNFVSNVISFVDNALNLIEKLLFIVLGLKAFNQGTVKIPVIDSLINKYMD